MFGDIGGLADAIMMLFSILLSGYSPNLFFKSVIKAVFRVDTQGYTEENKRRKSKQRRHNNRQASPESQLKEAIKKSSTSRLPQQSGVSLVGNHLKAILEKLQHLKRFKLSWWAAICLNKCLCLRRTLRFESKRSQLKKEKLFGQGIERIEQALDIRQLLRT